MIETVGTRVVVAEDCDELGHMNVSRYFATVSDGMFGLQRKLGLETKEIAGDLDLSFVVVRAESDFRAELVAGDAFRLMTRVAEIGTKSAAFAHQLIREADGAVAFETIFRCVLMDLGIRRAIPIPPPLRAALEPLMAAAEQ